MQNRDVERRSSIRGGREVCLGGRFWSARGNGDEGLVQSQVLMLLRFYITDRY